MSRNMEKRRETSRFAARDRRGKESEIFSDLRAVVPIVDEGTVTHLDRIAVLRVCAAWCRIRKSAPNVLKPLQVGPEVTSLGKTLWTEDTITESLDGFVIIVDSDGTILCVTESVALYLGLSQTDLVGRALKEFLHPSDYTEYVEMVNSLGSVLAEHPDLSKSPENGILAELRMKTVITQRGRNLNLKSALYKPISFILRVERSLVGHVVRMLASSEPAGQGSVNAHATALTKYADTPTGSFMTRHTSDMRISYVHDRLNYILRNELKTLMGASFFELIEPNDLQSFHKSMKTLFAKGHVRTPLYRLLAANNTLVWLTTEASTVNHTSKGQRAQYVICVHHIAGIKGVLDTSPSVSHGVTAGVGVEIKKEIDDTREYAGRQPHIDGTGALDFQMQPFTAREDFSVMSRLLSSFTDTEPVTNPSLDGTSEGSSGTFSDAFFRSHSDSATQNLGQLDGHSPTSDPSLASAAILATPSRGSPSDVSPAHGGIARGAGGGSSSSPLADSIAHCGLYSPPSSARSKLSGGLDGRLDGGQSSTSPRSLPSVCASGAVTLSSALLSDDGCEDASALLSTLSAAIARPSSSGNLSAMTLYSNVQNHCTPTFEDIPFEEPNLDSIAIRAPYVSRHGACDNLGTPLEGSTLGFDDFGVVDLSNEDFNSMFEQVISQSRPSAGRAVLGNSLADPYTRYPMDNPMVSGACPGVPYRCKVSPPLKRPALESIYDDHELKSLSINNGVYCGTNIWPNDAGWSDQQRTLYQHYGGSVSRLV
ncbi:hypothetical protein Q1695_003119 [Nippostrongylus brasiliensis]|nr:hypothetical protein Q1695_003119 [Nippostrongylus brasiliensis]